jgi:hypothetical protein
LLPVPEAVMDEFDDTVIKDERLELIFARCLAGSGPWCWPRRRSRG